MIQDLYNYGLIFVIVVCLILFYLELRIFVKQKIILPSLTSIKFLFILAILFFVTALVLGSAITGYITKEVIGENVNQISQGVGDNALAFNDLTTGMSEIKRKVAQSTPSLERDALLVQIDYLEHKLKNQMNNNRDLEDDIDDLQDELDDLYALLPSGNY
jgi:hypothetical protein